MSMNLFNLQNTHTHTHIFMYYMCVHVRDQFEICWLKIVSDFILLTLFVLDSKFIDIALCNEMLEYHFFHI